MALVVLGVFSACSCDGNLSGDGCRLLRIVPYVPVPVITKHAGAVLGPEFPSDREIRMSVCRHSSGGTSDNYIMDMQVCHKSDGWSDGGLWPADGSLDVLCMSADDFNRVGRPEWAVRLTDSVTVHVCDCHLTQDDLMFGCRADVSYHDSGGSIKVAFSHSLSLVSFKVLADGYDSGGSGDDIVTLDGISMDNVFCDADVTAANESGTISFRWHNLSQTHDLQMLEKPLRTGSGETLPAGTAMLVIPQAVPDITVRFATDPGDGTTDCHEFTVHPVRGGERWTPGVHYIYTLHLRPASAIVETAVEPWMPNDLETHFTKLIPII